MSMITPFKLRILQALNRKSVPTPLGELSVSVFADLSKVQETLQEMEEDGLVKKDTLYDLPTVAYSPCVRSPALLYEGKVAAPPEERKTTKMAKTVGIDYDGVLGDFQSPILDLYRSLFGIRMMAEDVTEWDLFGVLSPEQKKELFQHIGSPGWCASIPLYPEAKFAIRELTRMGHTLLCITAPWDSDTWESERRRAIQKDFPQMKVIATHHKEYVACDVLIEDKASNLEAWVNRQGGKGYLIPHPYNRVYSKEKMKRVSWDVILAELETGLNLT